MIPLRTAVAVAAGLLAADVLAATVRYVSPTGGGDGLKPDTPTTFAAAVADLAALTRAKGWKEAKEIVLTGGVYPDLYVTSTDAGSGRLTALAGDYVVIRSQFSRGLRCRIRPPDGSHAVFGGVYERGGCNVRFRDLIVDGAAGKLTGGFFAADVLTRGSRGEISGCEFTNLTAKVFLDLSGSVDWVDFAAADCRWERCVFDRNLSGIKTFLPVVTDSVFSHSVFCSNAVELVAFEGVSFTNTVFSRISGGVSARALFSGSDLVRSRVEYCETGNGGEMEESPKVPFIYAAEGDEHARTYLRDTLIIGCFPSSLRLRDTDSPLVGSVFGGGTLYIVGCTIVENEFAVFHNCDEEDLGPVIANSIVVGNRFYYEAASPTDLSSRTFHSFFQDELGSVTRVGPTCRAKMTRADVRFADQDRGDYHLRYRSPARDAGDDAWTLPRERDGDGRQRILGAAVDIGAFEFPVDGTAISVR